MADSPPDTAPAPALVTSRVLELNRLSDTGYELVVERAGITFKPGQLINIHGRSHLEDRSYTVCSGDRDEHLTVLFRLIPGGVLTPQLVRLKPGDPIRISGPYGEFTVRDATRPLVFFATGTGVAPCRAYMRSHAGLDITLAHGVRTREDLFYRETFARLNYHPCLSADPDAPGVFHGRVTDFARRRIFPPDAHYYLCGANEMIYEVREILLARGIDRATVFSEEYYYRSDD
jgi:NAD(P)H-flavin reductase